MRVTSGARVRQQPSVRSGDDRSILPLTTEALTYTPGGARVIDGVGLRIDRSPCTAVMGYNGSGKSTLLRLLHGLIRPTSGRVLWRGREADAPCLHAQGMVFQAPVILRRSVESNLRYPLIRRGLDKAEVERRVEEALRAADMAHARKQSARTLSAGERQRIAIVRALSLRPQVLFLDEPTASLDPSATRVIEELLCEAAARRVKLIIVSQNRGQVKRLASDVLFLHQGVVLEHTSRDAFFERPESKVAQDFLAGRLPG